MYRFWCNTRWYITSKIKLHVYFFHFDHQYIRLVALDFLLQVPLHRIPHCDIIRTMIIRKISSWKRIFNTLFFIVFRLMKMFLCIYCNSNLFVSSVHFHKYDRYKYSYLCFCTNRNCEKHLEKFVKTCQKLPKFY